MAVKLLEKFLDFFFPKICLGCKKEGCYLCPDCQETIEVFSSHKKWRGEFLDDLYFATDYKSPLLKKLVRLYKYSPFIKDLSKDLSFLIIKHFKLLEKSPNFKKENFLILPIPLEKRRLRWRGFNQAEEIAKILAAFFQIPLVLNILERKKATLPQVNLTEKERKENIQDAFFVKKKEKISGKNVLLIDDIFTTGSTLEEAAKVLKEAGAKKVIGIVIAKAQILEDKV
jgi:Predicted amidophosphoribosyltransferases